MKSYIEFIYIYYELYIIQTQPAAPLGFFKVHQASCRFLVACLAASWLLAPQLEVVATCNTYTLY